MSLARETTLALGGDWHGDQGTIPTPGHSKNDRGTVIADNEDGTDIIVHSFNGGDWRTIKDAARAAGVRLPEGGDNRERERDRETGHYEYADADGAVLYRTVRIERAGKPKRFLAQHPNGRGGWNKGLGSAARVPYRLPELLTADRAETVYLVEGERKADKLASWGLVATAIVSGAKAWRKSYAAHLAGRAVAILPDNDDPGREFADRARTDIAAQGGRAVIVELPGLPPKGDIIDWTGTADELRALADAAINPPAKLLPLLDPAAWEGEPTPPREWALAEWIPARQATYLTGPGSAGKSLLAQQLCTCIAAGLPFMGVETRRATAIYVTCEDDADELHRRQKAICEALGVPLSGLAGRLHLVSLAGAIGNELATFDPSGRMILADAYRTLRETALATGAGFVALDNVAHLFAGNENIRNQVAAFCGLLNQLAQETGGAVLFLGHPNKAGDSFSGSTAWENQVRSRLFMETPKSDEGAMLDADARVLSRGKANYARTGETLAFRWHRWAFVREADLPPNYAQEIAVNVQTNGENEIFLACLAERNRQRRPVSEKRSPTYAPTEFAKMPECRGIGKARLEAAMDRLFRIGRIERAVLWRDSEKGRDVAGLRETPPNGAPERSHNTIPQLPHTVAGSAETRPPDARDRHSISYGYNGAAPGEATPDPDDIIWERDE